MYNGFYLISWVGFYPPKPVSLGRDEVILYKAENALGCILALYLTVRALRMKASAFPAFRNCFPLFSEEVSLLHNSLLLYRSQ